MPLFTTTQVLVADHGITAVHLLVNWAGSGDWTRIEATPHESAEAHMACPYFATFHATKVLLGINCAVYVLVLSMCSFLNKWFAPDTYFGPFPAIFWLIF